MIRLQPISVRRRLMIEIHSNISAANVYLSSKQYFALAKVEIDENSITILFGPRDVNSRNQIKVISPVSIFIPSSLHKLSGQLTSLKNESCSVVAEFNPRLLNFSGSCTYVASFRLEIKPSALKSLSQYDSKIEKLYFPPVRPNIPYTVTCNICDAKLANREVSFNKVSDLDMNLLDSSENWYCHSRSNLYTVFQDSSEVFVNDSSYSLKCLDVENLVHDGTVDVVRCKNCMSVLSAVKHRYDCTSLLCFKDKIVLKSVEEPKPCLKASDACLAVLLDIIENTLSSAVTCKLYLEAKASSLDKNCLLLWVMDYDHMKYKSAETKNKEVLEELKFERVMKVLFFLTRANHEIARSWIAEFSVDHHFVSDEFLDSITCVLNESLEKVINCDQNVIKMFSIGYLPVRKKVETK